MSAAPGPSEPTRTRRWFTVSVVVLAIAGLGVWGWSQDRAQDRRLEQEASEPTAWQLREQWAEVAAESALVVGLPPEPAKDEQHPLTCERPDGRQGSSFFIPSYEGDPVPDSAVQDLVRTWQALGYTVSSSGEPGSRSIGVTGPDGAYMLFSVGPHGAGLMGETGCAPEQGGA
ncbi:hypothetical protein [Cellulomonas bogoriensis]|nr:hypothetical protein [Cellulomonas bogoriensis]